jgi:Zn-dependent protease/CBS domain-containing protein
MQNSLRIGNVFGINIKINWSWIFIFFLVTWNLTSSFGQAHPDWSLMLRVAVSLLAAVLFFASIIAHELSHSVMARSRGVPVRGITMFFFGGVSNIQRHPPSPAAEFLIAVVGPLTSILLGVIFIVLASILGVPLTGNIQAPASVIADLGPIPTLLLWLGPVNLILGVFNLVPGFPLDGGRILRSILWGITDDLRRATKWASWVGQGIAWLMIGGGVAMIFGVEIPFFGTGFVNGLWLAFIGWFLNSASVQSYQKIVLQDILEGVPIKKVLREDPPTVTPSLTIDELVHQQVMKTDEYAFPVIESGALQGMITLDDVRQVPRAEWKSQTVKETMTPREDLVTLTLQNDAADAFNEISQAQIRQVPVLEGETCLGTVRRKDILKWLALESDMMPGSGLMLSNYARS